MRILVSTQGKSMYTATTESGEVLVVSSRMPLFDSARVLLAKGYPGDTRLDLVHEGSDLVSMSLPLSKAAGLAVSDPDKGSIKLVSYEANPLYASG